MRQLNRRLLLGWIASLFGISKSMTIQGPPRFLGQAGPQTANDWIALQKWFVSVTQAVNADSMNLSFSTNQAWDTAGTPDTRPGTWGNAGVTDNQYPFKNVPSGKRVRLMRIYGSINAWAHGTVPAGKNAGILFGILRTDYGGTPYLAGPLGSEGNPVYIQSQIGGDGCTVPFDLDISSTGLLAADNIMVIRQAIYLNDTGLSIHQEVSLVIEFQYH